MAHFLRSSPLLQSVAAAVTAAAAVMAAPANSTTATGFTAVQWWRGLAGPLDIKADKTEKWDLFLKTKDDSDVHVVRNAIAIDGQSGWHSHPGPSLITVTVGEITVYDTFCAATRYRAGQTFVDAGGDHAHLLRNESGAVAETVVVQFVPRGAARREDIVQPETCNV